MDSLSTNFKQNETDSFTELPIFTNDFGIGISPAECLWITAVGIFCLAILHWIHLLLKTQRTPKRLYSAKKKDSVALFEDIPVVLGYPILGIIPLVVPYIVRKRFDLFFADFSKTYGKLVGVNVGAPNFLLIVGDAAVAKRALNDESFIRNDTLQSLMIDISPYALFSIPSGDIWRKHRKGLQPAFGPVHLRDAVDISSEISDSLMDVWSNSKTRNVMDDFIMATCDIITRVAFSVDLGGVKSLAERSEKGEHFHHHLGRITRALEIRFANVATKFMWPLFGASETQIKPSVKYIQSLLLNIIAQKKDSLSKSKGDDGVWAQDLLDRLLLESRFTDEEIISEVFGFFLAGHETTSNTITWALSEIVQKPDVRGKLIAEIDEVLKGEQPTPEILPKMKYLDAFFKELLRYHIVLRYNIRVTTKETVLTTTDGTSVVVPANVGMLISTHTLHTSPEYWGETADQFDPDRWLATSGASEGFVPISGSYLPFGDGHMSCIGQRLALIMMKTMVIRILQRFNVSLSKDQGPIEPISEISVGLKGGLLVDVNLRE
ncbi:hypothetical protein HK098_004423 [Nowakowskiella sp. JEL0407]|nr:hypothetical protein HK098_004423 [Nowakowskiella sp. JEL0407]